MRIAALGVILLGGIATGASFGAEGSVAAECQRDLESLPAFLLANDAGGRAAWNRFGEEHFDEAMHRADASIASVTDADDCIAVLRAYLKSWRDGHLTVYDRHPHAAPSGDGTPPPRVEWLSRKTTVLVFPSFEGAERGSVVKLLKENHDDLARRENWIIDVRGNGGGSDSTFLDILRWLGPASRVEVQPEYWVTPENIAANERTCALLGAGDDQCEAAMRTERERMRQALMSSWIRQRPGPVVVEVHQGDLEPIRPKHVAILVEDGCKSSCEEFLLAARQSFTVKLVGQHSGGTLDYSNLRPYPLPSGDRILLYAVTRSLRIPAMPVDGIGVMPDVFVPAGVDLVKSALRWLEGGSLP